MEPEFADVLSRLLQEVDRSASWLARRLHLHPSTVSRWLDGTSYPQSLMRVEEIAEVLGVHEAQMVRDLTQAYRAYFRHQH